jgi:hypothetical protein
MFKAVVNGLLGAGSYLTKKASSLVGARELSDVGKAALHLEHAPKAPVQSLTNWEATKYNLGIWGERLLKGGAALGALGVTSALDDHQAKKTGEGFLPGVVKSGIDTIIDRSPFHGASKYLPSVDSAAEYMSSLFDHIPGDTNTGPRSLQQHVQTAMDKEATVDDRRLGIKGKFLGMSISSPYTADGYMPLPRMSDFKFPLPSMPHISDLLKYLPSLPKLDIHLPDLTLAGDGVEYKSSLGSGDVEDNASGIDDRELATLAADNLPNIPTPDLSMVGEAVKQAASVAGTVASTAAGAGALGAAATGILAYEALPDLKYVGKTDNQEDGNG